MNVQAGETIVEVAGELDLATAPSLEKVLTRDGGMATGRVVVDVSPLTFMGVAGLSVLVDAHHGLLGENWEGLVVRGAAGIVRRVVDLTGVSFLLEDTDPGRAVSTITSSSRCVLQGRTLEVGRRAARLSVTDLFVAYFALGGTADLAAMRAFLGGRDDALDAHQQDVAAYAVNERLVELGHRDRLLWSASPHKRRGWVSHD